MTKCPRILVVDDEPGMLAAVARVLGRRYDLVECPTPAAALAAARLMPADLALIDVRLPEMSGFELIQRLRDVQPDVDVVIMTGSVHDLDARMVQSIRANAYYFIQKPFDRDVILTLVERCVETRRLARENKMHTARLERELQLARAFQQSLLPPGAAAAGRLRFDARYVPCTELGGDLYDYVVLPPDGLVFLVADVSGHGVAAAMLTGIVKSAFHTCHDASFDPAVVATRIAEGLRPFGTNRFVTLFCARVDSPSRLTYVNAGHPSALLWGARGGLRELESTGPLLTPIFAGERWDNAVVELKRGHRLLAYTDGLTDREGENGQAYGAERVRRLVEACGGKPLIDRLLDDAHAFAAGQPPQDDLTLAWLALD